MAVPFAHEELQKLKKFIEFVTENPTILNLPQLDFVKKFIEKFGGKVPAGEFKFPSGSKCPFGGDAKTDTKPDLPDEDSEPEEAEMESDEESDLELDMEAKAENNHMDVDDADNKLNRDEKGIFVSHSIFERKPKKKRKVSQNRISLYKLKPKIEMLSSEDEAYNIDEYGQNPDDDIEDPIKTNDIDSDYEMSDNDDGDDDDDDYNENELLSKVTTRTLRSQIRSKKKKHSYKCLSTNKKKCKKPKPVRCAEKCKQKCTEKFDKKSRQDICSEFWALSFVDRKNYVLKYIERRKVRMRNTKNKGTTIRECSNRYYLRNAKGVTERVCLSFFLSTLCITSNVIKTAISQSDGNGHFIGQDNRGGNHKTKLIIQGTANVEGTDNTTGKEVSAGANKGYIKKHYDIQSKLNSNEDNTMEVEHSGVELNEQVHGRVSVEEKTVIKTTPSKANKKDKNQKREKKERRERRPNPVQCVDNCKMKCSDYFTEDQRIQICASFWSMDYKRRKDFILSRVESLDVTSVTTKEYRKTDRAMRAFSNRYFLRGPRGEKVRVCANFFMATLCISRHFVYDALRKTDQQTGSYAGEDQRGKHAPVNKIPDEMFEEVKRHIESYPTWVPRKGHKTRYLHSSLNIRKMYREYKQICEDEQRKYVSCGYFSRVFHKNFRLAFLKPTSKHAHKVSPKKRDTNENSVATASVAAGNNDEINSKKINKNISEFTGEEGGFWLPSTTTYRCVNAQAYPHQSVITSQPSVATTTIIQDATNSTMANHDLNRIHIEQDLRLQMPTQEMTVINYMGHSTQMHLVAPQQTVLQNDMMSYGARPIYTKDSSLFRL